MVRWAAAFLMSPKKMSCNILSFVVPTLTCLSVILQFAGLESIMTSITDVYPSHIRKGYRRELLLLLVCAFCYVFGLFLVSEVSCERCIHWWSRAIHHVRLCKLWQLLFFVLIKDWHQWVLFTQYKIKGGWYPVLIVGWRIHSADLWSLCMQWSHSSSDGNLPVSDYWMDLW